MHGFLPDLPGGDILIVAGDLTASDELYQYEKFHDWALSMDYYYIVVVAGNHDNLLQKNREIIGPLGGDIVYLEDSGWEYKGVKFWGSPWSSRFTGINPHCCAFTGKNDKEIAPKWDLIPSDTDILICHSPPYGVLDLTSRGKHVGSPSLQMALFTRLNPKLFVCAHIHEAYGTEPPGGYIQKAINASHVNERYQPVNPPIRIVL